MNYDDALAYLADHASYQLTGRIESPSLERISKLMDYSGSPERAYRVIHITGTNGKGSTSEMITRLLMAQGLSVGTYRSPHLERVNERLSYDDRPIDDDEFARQIEGVAQLEGLAGVRPTYFEAVTAAAFRWFAECGVDVAVVEVGLLGRWDATNVCDADVAVITNIGMDHNEFAGPTKADVAREKAGIITPHASVVIGETDPALVEIFRAEGGVAHLVRGEDFDVVDNRLALGGRLVDLRTPSAFYRELFVPLHGRHQGDNAIVALSAAETFFGAPIAEDVVAEAFAAVEMPGRFEVLGHQPLVVIDGAHNPAGADSCAEVFFDDFAPNGRRILVFGCLRGRDVNEMLSALRVDDFDAMYVAPAPTPRTQDPETIAAAAKAMGCDDVVVCTDVEDACARALRGADGDDAVLVAGSLYVVGAARPYLRHRL